MIDWLKSSRHVGITINGPLVLKWAINYDTCVPLFQIKQLRSQRNLIEEDGDTIGYHDWQIGGSISGLMCGVVLKHAGHHVCIIEKDSDQRDSHMAGVGLGLDFKEFLARHDRFTSPFVLESKGVQVMKSSSDAVGHIGLARMLTSWDALYYRLRGIFDGYTSRFFPEPPSPFATDGSGENLSRRQVMDLYRDLGGTKVAVEVQDLDTEKTVEMKADFVIGADGPSPFVRRRCCPLSQRKYAGYVAWRGTVPESELTVNTQVFQQNIITLNMEKQHCLVYMIPGPGSSLKAGERMVNFLWYTNENEGSLSEIMVDSVSGKQHRNTVPAGHVREDIWRERLKRAKDIPFTPPFLELVQKIPGPFIQAISDFCAPQAAFEEGKVLLVGDAVSSYRPHIGFSGTQAAFHALRVGDYTEGRMDSKRWEERVLRYSWVYWSQSVWWGEFYQGSRPVAMIALLRYWTICGIDRITSWWYGG